MTESKLAIPNGAQVLGVILPEDAHAEVVALIKASGKDPITVAGELILQGLRCRRQNHDGRIA